jgi:hypothetical protein
MMLGPRLSEQASPAHGAGGLPDSHDLHTLSARRWRSIHPLPIAIVVASLVFAGLCVAREPDTPKTTEPGSWTVHVNNHELVPLRLNLAAFL